MSNIQNDQFMENFYQDAKTIAALANSVGVTREEGQILTDLITSKAILTKLVKDKDDKEDWIFWVNPKLSMDNVPSSYNII